MSKSQFPKKRKLGCRTQLRAAAGAGAGGGGLVSLLTSPAVGQFRLRAPVQPPANRQPSPHLAPPTRAKCRVN